MNHNDCDEQFLLNEKSESPLKFNKYRGIEQILLKHDWVLLRFPAKIDSIMLRDHISWFSPKNIYFANPKIKQKIGMQTQNIANRSINFRTRIQPAQHFHSTLKY